MSNHRTQPQPRHCGIGIDFATTAYRADLAGRTQPFGDHDAEWVAVANLLEQAARLPACEAAALLRRVEELAAAVVAPAALEALVQRDWQNGEIHPVDPIVALADEAHDRNAFRLAAHMLDSLLAANRSLSELQRGRIFSRQARIAFKLGDLDGAADRYAQILRMGRALENPELRARGWVGRAGIAQYHGNYPEVWRCARCAARIADRNGLGTLSYYAHTWLMIAAGESGRVDDCLAHGWLAYQSATGDPMRKAEMLTNVSQALFLSGHVRQAWAGWAAVVATHDVVGHAVLPALGGLSLASAVLGDGPRARWAARQIKQLARAGAPRYNVASALLECATAFATLGQTALATQHAAAALRLARAHGFHEIAFKAESLDVSSPTAAAIRRVRLNARGAAVARDVERLEPDRLPNHVALATVGDG